VCVAGLTEEEELKSEEEVERYVMGFGLGKKKQCCHVEESNCKVCNMLVMIL
jgi:hypothetical protein